MSTPHNQIHNSPSMNEVLLEQCQQSTEINKAEVISLLSSSPYELEFSLQPTNTLNIESVLVFHSRSQLYLKRVKYSQKYQQYISSTDKKNFSRLDSILLSKEPLSRKLKSSIFNDIEYKLYAKNEQRKQQAQLEKLDALYQSVNSSPPTPEQQHNYPHICMIRYQDGGCSYHEITDDLYEQLIQIDTLGFSEHRNVAHQMVTTSFELDKRNLKGYDQDVKAIYDQKVRPRIRKRFTEILFAIRNQGKTDTQINIFDIGCGKGEMGVICAQAAQLYNFKVNLFASDIIKKNVLAMKSRTDESFTLHADVVDACHDAQSSESILSLIDYLKKYEDHILANNTINIAISSGALCIGVIPHSSHLDDIKTLQQMFACGIDHIIADGMKPPMFNPMQTVVGAELIYIKNHRPKAYIDSPIDEGGEHWTIELKKQSSTTIAENSIQAQELNIAFSYCPGDVIKQISGKRSNIHSINLTYAYFSTDTELNNTLEMIQQRFSGVEIIIDIENYQRIWVKTAQIKCLPTALTFAMASMPTFYMSAHDAEHLPRKVDDNFKCYK